MINVQLTIANLREISESAHREFVSRAKTPEMDNSEFLTLCYAAATERFLVKTGVSVNMTYAPRMPYDTADE